MRVLHLLSSTGFHGAENMAAELIRSLSAEGIENHVGTFWSGEKSNTDILLAVHGDVKLATAFRCRGKWDWRTVIDLRSYLRKHRIDVIHSHKYKTNLYAAVARIGQRCVLVATCHNWLLTDPKLRLYAAFDKRVLRKFDKVVGVSQEVVDELRRYVPRDRTARIANGVDLEKFSRSSSRADAKARLDLRDRRVVGFVGRLSRDKAVSVLLQAAKLLEDQAMPVDVVVVGDGEQETHLRKQTATLGIARRVHFLGRRHDTPELYAAMDVFVLPSLKEAFPMVVLEAMAAGVPVIATRVGDIPYILGDVGKVVNPGSVEQLAKALHQLLADEAAAREMAAAGYQRVHDHFSSAAMARNYRQLYSDAWDLRYGSI